MDIISAAMTRRQIESLTYAAGDLAQTTNEGLSEVSNRLGDVGYYISGLSDTILAQTSEMRAGFDALTWRIDLMNTSLRSIDEAIIKKYEVNGLELREMAEEHMARSLGRAAAALAGAVVDARGRPFQSHVLRG